MNRVEASEAFEVYWEGYQKAIPLHPMLAEIAKEKHRITFFSGIEANEKYLIDKANARVSMLREHNASNHFLRFHEQALEGLPDMSEWD